MQKYIAMRFFVCPKGFAKPRLETTPTGGRFLPRGTQSAGHGLFESPSFIAP